MDITDDTLSYVGISVVLLGLLAIVVNVLKYSCERSNNHGELEDPILEV
jgi:hypothetical protein